MFFSASCGLEYVEIPKAACSAIKKALLRSDGIEVEGPHMHDNPRWRANIEAKRRFTVVRHPVRRCWSAYREKVQTGKAQRIDNRCTLPETATFGEWVDWLGSIDLATANHHWRPQSVIVDAAGKLDWVGRLESVATGWHELGLPPLEVINAIADDPHPRCPQWISGDEWLLDRPIWHREIDALAKLYHDDFQRWSYSPDEYRPAPNVSAWKDVQGFLSEEEGEELQRLAWQQHVVEVGCWKGRSTIAMAATAKHVTTIDHYRGDAFAGEADTFAGARESLRKANASHCVTVVVGDGLDVLRWLPCDDVGFVLYDADHTYHATRAALELIDQRTKCRIGVHDYDTNPNHAGVRKAVDEFVAATGRTVRTVERLAVIERA